jgi:hypothetical protein
MFSIPGVDGGSLQCIADPDVPGRVLLFTKKAHTSSPIYLALGRAVAGEHVDLGDCTARNCEISALHAHGLFLAAATKLLIDFGENPTTKAASQAYLKVVKTKAYTNRCQAELARFKAEVLHRKCSCGDVTFGPSEVCVWCGQAWRTESPATETGVGLFADNHGAVLWSSKTLAVPSSETFTAGTPIYYNPGTCTLNATFGGSPSIGVATGGGSGGSGGSGGGMVYLHYTSK